MTTPPRDSTRTILQSTVVCVHEDRPDYLTGVKLAILGLGAHDKDLRVLANCPGAPDEFRSWIGKQPNAELAALGNLGAAGWNVKAAVLLRLLEDHDEAIWIDSDILVTSSVRQLLTGLDADVFLATEETFWGQEQGGSFRTSAWGLSPGRTIATTVNSGILRVTRAHVPLLRAWQSMLAHPSYLQSQTIPWYERPLHMIGDQEVLTALLGSTDFAHIPVRLLRRGIDIAQCFGPSGFTPGERLRAVRKGCPPFIHAMGPKPWRRAIEPPAVFGRAGPLARAVRDYYEYLSLDVSPYTLAATPFFRGLAEPAPWMQPHSRAGRFLATISRGSVCLTGLPVALFDHVARYMRRRLGIARYAKDTQFALTERPF